MPPPIQRSAGKKARTTKRFLKPVIYPARRENPCVCRPKRSSANAVMSLHWTPRSFCASNAESMYFIIHRKNENTDQKRSMPLSCSPWDWVLLPIFSSKWSSRRYSGDNITPERFGLSRRATAGLSWNRPEISPASSIG